MATGRTGYALVFMILAISSRIDAQSHTDSCIAKLPPNVFTRVPILIDAGADDSASVILPSADILNQILTEHIRKSLGSETGPLPAGDSAVSWQQLGGSVIVTAHHDGAFTWRKDSTVSAGFMRTDGLDILTRALGESSAAGDRLFWPDGAKQDSLSYRLSFASPRVRQNGKLEPLKVRVANPVFTLMIPWFKDAEMTDKPRIAYPIKAERTAEGYLTLEFVVDTLGRIPPGSVKEVFEPGVKRMTEAERAYYDSFLASVRRGVPTGKYKPATIAGCPINQQVRQMFDFKLAQ